MTLINRCIGKHILAVVKNEPSPNCAIRLRQKQLLIDLAGAEFACINVMLVQQL
jgi:hypothetical protein